MKMPKKKIQKWIDDLRSGKFQQARYKLEEEYGLCCLGVLCKTQASSYRIDHNGLLVGTVPRTIYGAPGWIAHINKDFSERTNGVSLLELNDQYKFNFKEIADLLQAVYIEEVLS